MLLCKVARCSDTLTLDPRACLTTAARYAFSLLTIVPGLLLLEGRLEIGDVRPLALKVVIFELFPLGAPTAANLVCELKMRSPVFFTSFDLESVCFCALKALQEKLVYANSVR
tara:strand:+ start:1651 stop:1989 length:339 start_codon:yes stop_codon:yes gene_type:complete